MSKVDEALEWLDKQDYWVRYDLFREKYPDVELAESTGITVKEDEDGNALYPRRDLIALILRGDINEQ